MKISKRKGHLQDWITQVWVKRTGRRFDPVKDRWLMAPVGDTEVIADKFFRDLAVKENLSVRENEAASGLLPSFDVLQLTAEEQQIIHPRVRDFYEHTSNYHFEFWSEWCGAFRPFGWLLAVIFSRRLQQLNLPLRPMEASRGLNSAIIKLVDEKTSETKWTVWFRTLKSTNKVVYSGVYTTCNLPGNQNTFLKVAFPLPNGNAAVIMRREILPDGSLRLCSDGKKFGDNGFYFTLTDHRENYWARFVRSTHEWITVFVDDENVLRADHHLHFYGLPFLKLHYKMSEKSRS